MGNRSEYKYVNVRRYFSEADGFDFIASGAEGDDAAQGAIIGGFKSVSGMDSQTEGVGAPLPGGDALDLGVDTGDTGGTAFDLL